MTSISTLPLEVLDLVIKALPFKDLKQASLVSRKWLSVAFGSIEAIPSRHIDPPRPVVPAHARPYLVNLKVLNLSFGTFGANSAAFLTRLSKLETLRVWGDFGRVEESVAKTFKTDLVAALKTNLCASLTSLDLGAVGKQIDNQTVSQIISKMTKLRGLSLFEAQITAIDSLTSLTNLEVVVLPKTITDWTCLSVLKSLTCVMSQSPQLDSVWKSFQHDSPLSIQANLEKLKPLMFARLVWIYDQVPRPLSVAIADGLDELAIDGADTLVEAALICHGAKLEQLLTQMPEFFPPHLLNVPTPGGTTPLMAAASVHDFSAIQTLLKHNVNINLATPRGTALYAAAARNMHVTCSLLMQHGAYVNARHPISDMTPLHAASVAFSTRSLDVLIEKGADLNARTRSGATPLYLAVVYDKRDAMNKLIAAKADINACNTLGVSPLHAASARGNIDAVKTLLDAGADVNYADTRGWTALLNAAGTCSDRNASVEIARLLIRAKANVNSCLSPLTGQSAGSTALYRAAYVGHLELVQLLLDAGASPNLSKSNGASPLYVAAQEGHKDVVALLLTYNAHPSSPLQTGYTALHMAAENGHSEVCEKLIDIGKANVNAVDKYGRTPLGSVVAYCKRNPEETIEALLQRGANLNGEVEGNIRDPPLVLAAQQGRARMVQVLLQKGADHRPAGVEGFTALHVAWRNPLIVKMLIDAGADVNARNKQNRTPVHLAVGGCKQASLALMLAVPQVDVNIVSVAGWAPLHTAAYEGWHEGVKLLLQAGANVNIRVPVTATQTGHEGATPLYFAAIMGRLEVVKTLLEHKCDVNLAKLNGASALYVAAEARHAEICCILLQHKADVRAICKTCLNCTPLHRAIYNSCFTAVEALLNNGADINAKNIYASTPLHYANDNDNMDVEITKLLVKKGADLNARARFGQTALHIAAYGTKGRHVATLLDSGADYNARDDTGRTPLICAAQAGKMENIRLLVAKGANVNAVSKSGASALHHVVGSGSKEALQVLLDETKGVLELDLADLGGSTALGWACSQGREEMIPILIQAGASPNGRLPEKKKWFEMNPTLPLWMAIRHRHWGSMRKLLKSAPADQKVDVNTREKGHYPIDVVAKYNEAATRLLIEAGAEVNPPERYFASGPLIAAVLAGNYDTTQLLLASGAQSNAFDNFTGLSALAIATLHGRTKLVQLLQQHGANRFWKLTFVNLTSTLAFASTVVTLATYRAKVRQLVSSGVFLAIHTVRNWMRVIDLDYLS